jgi:hypothetical protein
MGLPGAPQQPGEMGEAPTTDGGQQLLVVEPQQCLQPASDTSPATTRAIANRRMNIGIS